MITHGEVWHNIAVKKWSALLRVKLSEDDGNLFCLNCLHSFRRKSKLEFHKKVCENKDLCNVIITSENNKALEFNKYQKSDKTQSIIYGDVKSLAEKIDVCKNNPEN